MLPRRDTAIDLEHRRVADRQRAVGLFGRKPMNVSLGSTRELGATGFRRPKVDDAVARHDFFADGESRDDLAGEIGKGEGVGKKACLAAAPHPRQREATGERVRRLVFPQDAQRQQPTRGGAGGLDLNLAEQNFVRVIADLGDIR
jgi:hypothetical protein